MVSSPSGGALPASEVPKNEMDIKGQDYLSDELSSTSEAEDVELTPQDLFCSLADEPSQTLFSNPPEDQGEALSLALEDGQFPLALEEGQFTLRNLSTGEIEVIGSALAEQQERVYWTRDGGWSKPNAAIDPKQLRNKARKPWGNWWVDKQRKDQLLWSAVEAGDVEGMRTVLAYPADGSAPAGVNSRSDRERTALHMAVASGRLESIETLLQARANLDVQTEVGVSPLHIASQRGHAEGVRLLLNGRADVHVESETGNIAVHLASASGHTEVVSLLLDQGGSDQLMFRNHNGQLPAEAAADINTAELFANHEARLSIPSSDGETLASESDLAAAGEHDTYSKREMCKEGGVLLRNARADAVQRLLQQTQLKSPRPSATSAACEVDCSSRGGATVTSSQSARTRKPFVKVRSGELLDDPTGPTSFELVKLLGRGSFGEVYQVKHKHDGNTYAMKVLQKKKVMSSNLLRFAWTERNILAYVHHPYIVTMHYAFQTPSHLVMVLHFATNGNLQNLINQHKRLHNPLARLYTSEILTALIYLHERNTIFRDLKPENVVIDSEHHALLTDFGLSKEGVVGGRGAKTFAGSIAFLAPEILLRRGHGHPVDIYNLGVLLHAMLTGRPPFYHEDRETLFSNIKRARLEIPEIVQRDAQSLIRALMVRDPSKRLGAARTVDIQAHEYFMDLDWDALHAREVSVPVEPMTRLEMIRKAEKTPFSVNHPANVNPFGQSDTNNGRRGWFGRNAVEKQGNSRGGGDKEPEMMTGWEFTALPVKTAQQPQRSEPSDTQALPVR